MKPKILIVPFLLSFGILFSSCAILFLEETVVASTAVRAVAGRAALATATRTATFRVASRATATRLSRIGIGVSGESVVVSNSSLFSTNLNNLRLVGNNLMLQNEMIGTVIATGLIVDGESIPMDLTGIYVVTENNVLVTSLPNILPLTRLSKGAFVFSDGEKYDDKLKVTVRINPKVSGINPIQPGYINSSQVKLLSDYLNNNKFENSSISNLPKTNDNISTNIPPSTFSNNNRIPNKINDFSITNNTNLILHFQVSMDNQYWSEYYINPSQKMVFPQSNFLYIRTWTNGNDYKTLNISSFSNYQIVWDSNEKKFAIISF